MSSETSFCEHTTGQVCNAGTCGEKVIWRKFPDNLIALNDRMKCHAELDLLKGNESLFIGTERYFAGRRLSGK